MSQHDYELDNATGALFRADLNAVLDAIASNNSGASAPSVTFPNQWWYDQTLDRLKQRNSGNTAWVAVADKDASGWNPIRQGVPLGSSSVVDIGTSGATIPLLNGSNIWSVLNRFRRTADSDAIQVENNTGNTRIALGLTSAANGRIILYTSSGPQLVISASNGGTLHVGGDETTGLEVLGIKESGQGTIAPNSIIEYTHNLGVRPREFWGVFRCLTPEFGFSAGDEIPIQPATRDTSNNNADLEYGATVGANSINVFIIFGSSPLKAQRKNAPIGDPVTLTTASWRSVLRWRP